MNKGDLLQRSHHTNSCMGCVGMTNAEDNAKLSNDLLLQRTASSTGQSIA